MFPIPPPSSSATSQLPLSYLIVTSLIYLSTVGQKRKKHRHNSHPIIHCQTSKGVSEVSKWANKSAAKRASKASRAEQANEEVVLANKRTDERVAQYFCLGFWLIWPTVLSLSNQLFLHVSPSLTISFSFIHIPLFCVNRLPSYCLIDEYCSSRTASNESFFCN